MSWGTREYSAPMPARSSAEPSSGLLTRLMWYVFHGPAAFLARVLAAAPFFVAGQANVEGTAYSWRLGPWFADRIPAVELGLVMPGKLKDAVYLMYRNDIKLPFSVPPDLLALAVTGALHLLPALMVLGLLTRLSAVGLLAMGIVAIVFASGAGAFATYGMAILLCALIAGAGPGWFSLDHLIMGRRP